MTHRWIECALAEYPDNRHPIPWSIHVEQRSAGLWAIVEINVRTDTIDEGFMAEAATVPTAISRALTAFHAAGL